MTILEAIILGLVQGLTEFLPVSSSGHLVITQEILGLQEPGVTLEVLLHFGTLLSVFWVFGRDFLNLLQFRKNKEERRFLIMLIAGVIVTGLMGIFLSGYTDQLFQSTLLVGVMLLVTGIILKIITVLPAGLKDKGTMTLKDALWIGFIQGMAIIPGISRSGSTIMAALWRGLNRETAVKYSFMLAAPIILGGTLLEIREIFQIGINQAMLLNYFAGGLVAFLSGVVAIKIFIRLLAGGHFQIFACYCWAAGTLIIIYSLLF